MEKHLRVLLLALLFSANLLFSQELVKIATYNVLNYPDNSFSRNPYFALIMDEIDPDILVVQEIKSQTGVNQFRSNVLGSKYNAGTFVDGPDDDRAIFYKDSLFTFVSNNPIKTSLRDINEFTVVHNFTQDTLRLYGLHLKASSGSDNEQRRLDEVTSLRSVTDQLSDGVYFIVLGDFNVYSSFEPAYIKLLDNSTPGYVIDPINKPGGWNNNSAFAEVHTQSTRTDNIGDGGSTGGLDDRFDQILISESIYQPGGVDYVSGTYTSFGNDGNHFNGSINDGTNTAVGSEVANALYIASDHLPVYAVFDFGISTGVDDPENSELNFELSQNYPNPFNPSTKISYSLSENSNVIVKIYDILGKQIVELVNEIKLAGTYTTEWNASDYSSGIYFYSIEASSISSGKYFSNTKKMMLVK